MTKVSKEKTISLVLATVVWTIAAIALVLFLNPPPEQKPCVSKSALLTEGDK